MQKSCEDCFYFLTSTCTKGSSCPYRHNPVVLTSNVICPAWLRSNCIDFTCPLRHTAVQRPTINNGITCFYENTSTGCLKLDCTFVHLRPRPNLRNSSSLRPSTTNLVNKDVIKLSTSQVTTVLVNQQTNSVEIPLVTETSVTTIKEENVPQQTEKCQDVQPRVVVIGESTSNRKVVHGTTNRVVVSSEKKILSKESTNDTDSDIDLDDLIQQESETKKPNGPIDIPFPCSAPSITNRLFTTTKQSTPTNDTKPIRLNRDCLPAAKLSNSNLSNLSNEEKTFPGTSLSNDDERRMSRIERFKKKPNSPARIIVESMNERKRQASEQNVDDSPPLKRLSLQQENNNNNNNTTIGDLCSPTSFSHRTNDRHRSHRRRRSSSPKRKSPLHQTYSSTMNQIAWNKEVDEFLAKTTQPKSQPVPLLSLNPRYIPPTTSVQTRSIPNPRQQISIQRPRQPAPSIVPKQSSTPVTIQKEIPTKSIEEIPIKNLPSTQMKIEDENKLLDIDQPTDVVDTFALIDEVLIETDNLFELL